MTRYPYQPAHLSVFRESSGYWIALDERDRRGGRWPYNIGGCNSKTKREAILHAREILEILGLDNSQYE
ncbi:MAG TPA: hypothetical protein DCQ64_07945 [Candidatus Rokubacteria bacterium]|nr:hypothetical protein [Candidatus Rokubacteria bacterium]